jgi:hypothetical protein
MSNKTDKDPTTTTGLPKKWNDIIVKQLPDWKETADAASVDDLKKIIVECEGNIYTVNKEEEADIKLQGAREMVKSLSEPHRDARKYQQAKIQYALLLLEGKGVDLDNKGD